MNGPRCGHAEWAKSEKRVGCFKRTASKHIYYLEWNRSPAQVGCMRQSLGPGVLGRPRGIGWRGRWEGGSGWGTHVNPWLFHFNVWQNPLQIKKKSYITYMWNQEKWLRWSYFQSRKRDTDIENKCMETMGVGGVGWIWRWEHIHILYMCRQHIHIIVIMYKIDN